MKNRILILLLVLLPLRAFAIFGVGDVVFDPQNYANNVSNQVQNIAKWVQQSQQMVMQITHLQDLINIQNSITQIRGDIRNASNSIMGSANQLMGLRKTMLQVPTLSNVRTNANPTRSMVTPLQYHAEQGAIGQYFSVGPNLVWRDPNRYKGYEAERVAIENVSKAHDDLIVLEDKTLKAIEQNQQVLSSSPNEAQAMAAQASIITLQAQMAEMKVRQDRATQVAEILAQQRALEDAQLATKADEERIARTQDMQTRGQASLAAQKTFRFVRQ